MPFAFATTSSKCSNAPTANCDPATRQALLTFVIAGGGFAGVELAGALNDYAHGILADYPKLVPRRTSGRPRPLARSHSPRTQRIARPLRAGAHGRARRRLSSEHPHHRCRPGPRGSERWRNSRRNPGMDCRHRAQPFLKPLPLEKDKRGALIVNDSLAVPSHPGLWALGDCAAVVDAKTKKPCPPTAQFALREAQTLAKNIRKHLQGRASQSLSFRFSRRALRRRPPDRLRRINRALRQKIFHALFRTTRLADVARHLSRQTSRSRAQNSRAGGLDCRTLFSARHRADHRAEVARSSVNAQAAIPCKARADYRQLDCAARRLVLRRAGGALLALLHTTHSSRNNLRHPFRTLVRHFFRRDAPPPPAPDSFGAWPSLCSPGSFFPPEYFRFSSATALRSPCCSTPANNFLNWSLS